jgi:3-isopropylmalate/(R)-2-methylmalate dehydratase small subunit
VILAPSYADIFFNNCFKNGILPIALEVEIIDGLFELATEDKALELTVDLEKQTIGLPDDAVIDFQVDEFRKHCLLNGLDDIGLTLQHVAEIRAYEDKRRQRYPWLFRAL